MKASAILSPPRPVAAMFVAASLIGVPPGAQALERTEVRQQHNVEFVTGGIGALDQQHTREFGRDMNLQLVFARADGAYVADVEVEVQGTGGKTVLELSSADPILFAELPPGRYEVIAEVDGQAVRRSVTVPARGQRVEYFHWQMR